ncbi:NADP oxidoreductase, coenzyme F420-dependent [Burkholderia sp. H160]|nr:NADP oxidoreductase, coenzyme F420-dependent [Burkholderia sp. H160]
MSYSTINIEKVASTVAGQFGGSRIAMGVANAHSPESIVAMAKRLGAQVAAMSLQDAPGTEVMILAMPVHVHAAIREQLSDGDHDDRISPDELMGILNAAR